MSELNIEDFEETECVKIYDDMSRMTHIICPDDLSTDEKNEITEILGGSKHDTEKYLWMPSFGW
jgi:hypothetical protein